MSALAALLALTLPASGPAEASAPLDLAGCLRAALAENAGLLESARALEVAEVQATRAAHASLPSLEYEQLVGAVNEARGDATAASTGVNDFLTGLGPFLRLELKVVQPLWTGGRLEAGEASAAAQVRSRRAALEARRAALLASVRDLFSAALLNRRLSRELAEVAARMTEARDLARQRLEEGADALVSPLDVLKLDFAVGGLERELARLAAGERAAKAALARAIGRSPAEALELVGQLGEGSAGPLELRPPRAARPEFDELEAGLAARDAQVSLARAEALPTLFVLGLVRFAVAPNRTDQLNPFVRDDFNYLDPGAVLGLRWRFGPGTLDAIREAEARRAELAAQREGAARGFEVERIEARGRLEAARRAVEVGERLRRAVRGQAFSAAAGYALGMGSAGEVLELLGMLARATTDLGLALHEHDKARTAMARAAGADLLELR